MGVFPLAACPTHRYEPVSGEVLLDGNRVQDLNVAW